MDFLRDVGVELAKVSTIIGILALLGKLLANTVFKAGLETHKANLKLENDNALAQWKHNFDKSLAEYKTKLDVTSKSDERIRAEIIAWANPIREAAESLQGRLDNILAREGYKALTDGFTHPEWSITYKYFMTSTLYLFARYFSWIHMLRQELSFELFRSQQDRVDFFRHIDAVSNALSSYGAGKPSYSGTGHDLQVFRLEQQALGEYMTVRSRKRRACCSYAWFSGRASDQELRRVVEPVFLMVDGLKPGEKRWERLHDVHTAVKELVAECNRVLKLPPVTS